MVFAIAQFQEFFEDKLWNNFVFNFRDKFSGICQEIIIYQENKKLYILFKKKTTLRSMPPILVAYFLTPISATNLRYPTF